MRKSLFNLEMGVRRYLGGAGVGVGGVQKFGVWGFGELSKTSEVKEEGVKNGNKNKGLIT